MKYSKAMCLDLHLRRLHKNADGTFVTPIRVYDGIVCVGRCCHDGGWRSISYNGYNK